MRVAAILVVLSVAAGAGESPTPPALEEFREALAQVIAYEHGQECEGLYQLDELVREGLNGPGASEGMERLLLEALESRDAAVACKQFVCKQLSVVGGKASVPVLAKLLDEGTVGEAARYALHRIPGEAADAALLEALGSTEGPARVGIIHSLGERRVKDAVPTLIKLLSDDATAPHAVIALGEIGGEEAYGAVLRCHSQSIGATREAANRALLEFGYRYLKKWQLAPAGKAFDEVYEDAKASDATRNAAFRGLALAAGPRLAKDALSSADPDRFAMGLRLVRDLPEEHGAGALAGLLPKLAPERKALLIAALADRGEAGALEEVTAAVKDDEPAVRTAALKALGTLGDASSVEVLLEAAASEEGRVRETARESLARLSAPGVDKALSAKVSYPDVPVQCEAIGAFARRQTVEAIPELLRMVEIAGQEVRIAVLEAMEVLASGEHAPVLLKLLAGAQTGEERAAAEAAAVSALQKRKDGEALAIAAPEDASSAEVRCALLRICGALGGNVALRAVVDALKDKDPDVSDTALRVLADWPNTGAMNYLPDVAREAKDERSRIIALRGYLRLFDQNPGWPPRQTAAMYADAVVLVTRAEEKKQILGGLARIPDLMALALTERYLEDEEVRDDGVLSFLQVAESIAGTHPDEVEQALGRFTQIVPDEALDEKSKEALIRIRLALGNLARGGKATSPDGLESDGAAGGDQAAIDGDVNTYWDEEDDKALYCLQVDFPEPVVIEGLSILGYKHHDYAPKDFAVVCDGAVVLSVKDAQYDANLLELKLPKTKCKSLQLKITGYYGKSPAIRELGIHGSKQ